MNDLGKQLFEGQIKKTVVNFKIRSNEILCSIEIIKNPMIFRCHLAFFQGFCWSRVERLAVKLVLTAT